MNSFYPSSRPPLQRSAFVPLPLGSVKPGGWLADQLRIQANGLTGHIDEFWPDLGPDNMWLGGNTEGWERGPYYLDGLVPLAFLLDDERLKSKAQKWIDSILDMQDESGWIGPVQGEEGRHPAHDQWPVMIILKVLTQYHEATGDPRVLDRMTRFCGHLRETLDAQPLFGWGMHRWADLVLSIHWLYNRTGERWLLDVAAKAREQGYDWIGHFADFQFPDKMKREECVLHTHVVNNAMAIKTPGMAWVQSGDPADREAVYDAMRNLDGHHGQVTGVFSGDEHYAGPNPSQGTELCAVVEYMFSLETLLSALGDPTLADRLERIAYNALPATITPDWWAHQYDQQVNQVLCTVAPRQWTNNGDDANIFGLEPNFGCCTANMHQGWPKLAASLWMATPDDGLAAVTLAPSEVTATVRGGIQARIEARTDYPFDETVAFGVGVDGPAEFPLMIRVPGWASGATISVAGGAPQAVEPGAFHTIDRAWEDGDEVVLQLPMEVQTQRRYHGSVAVTRGPLVYSLPIGERWERVGGAPEAPDWEIQPTTPWNYGLIAEEGMAITERGVSPVPFDGDAPPVELRAQGRIVEHWRMADNSAGEIPEAPVRSDAPLEDLRLIPYGCTRLRVTEFPLLEE